MLVSAVSVLASVVTAADVLPLLGSSMVTVIVLLPPDRVPDTSIPACNMVAISVACAKPSGKAPSARSIRFDDVPAIVAMAGSFGSLNCMS